MLFIYAWIQGHSLKHRDLGSHSEKNNSPFPRINQLPAVTKYEVGPGNHPPFLCENIVYLNYVHVNTCS